MKGFLLRRRGRGAAGAAADALRRDPAEAAPAIELEAVTISYAEADGAQRSIVEGFDLSLAPGQIHCLAGRSGSGKTSVLRVATATQAPSSGAVRWAGADVAQLSPDELASHRRRRMGYVDQGATVIQELTVLDNVLIPAMPEGITVDIERRAEELLVTFGLQAAKRQRAHSLSGGERQRLAIARALLLSPTAIALDEPTASLDRSTADTVIGAMRTAADSGAAILVASHDPGVVEAAETHTWLV